MFKLSVAFIAVTLVQIAFSNPLPLNGRDVTDDSAADFDLPSLLAALSHVPLAGNIPGLVNRLSRRDLEEADIESLINSVLTKAISLEEQKNENIAARDHDFLVGPDEHTGLAGTADHLGDVLKDLGAGLGDLL